MNDDLETRLRASLRERAEDVEPTPALWQQVDRKVARRRALPLFVWAAAGVAAVVTAVAVVPGLVDRADDGIVIDPAESPTRVESPVEDAPGPVAAAPLTHYVAVVDGRLVLRGVDGSEEEVLTSEGAVRTLAVRPGSTPERFAVAAVVSVEGMLDLAVVTRTPTETSSTQTFVGLDRDEAAAMPVPAWSPDGSTVAAVVTTDGQPELALLEVDDATEAGLSQQRIALAGVDDPAQLRLQDWSTAGEVGDLAFTAGGTLYRIPIDRAGDGWRLGGADTEPVALDRAHMDGYVVDVATHPDGRLYRLLAGAGPGSGDAEDAGLGLFLDDEPLAFPDLPTADPSGAWMTAVEGGVFVGLGDEARQVNVGDGRATMLPAPGVSYAAWIPVAGDAEAVPHGDPTESISDAPDGSASGSDVYPYVTVDPEGRVAVHTGDGGEREVILDEQLWAPEAGVRVLDVSVRPGSSAGEVAGVVLLATDGGPELAWFRAAAGETVTRRLEGPFGPGAEVSDPRRAPVWSPDGGHIAWIEPDAEGGWTLRTLGMADDGPTDDDAGFGLDVDAEELDAAGWSWAEDTGQVARGALVLVDEESSPRAGYAVPVERQADGALAVTGPTDRLAAIEGGVADVGLRDGRLVVLLRSQDGWVLRQGGDDVPVPLDADAVVGDLDLDVLESSVVVTDRRAGEAYVVDTTGAVEPLGTEAHGFDPVR